MLWLQLVVEKDSRVAHVLYLDEEIFSEGELFPKRFVVSGIHGDVLVEILGEVFSKVPLHDLLALLDPLIVIGCASQSLYLRFVRLELVD